MDSVGSNLHPHQNGQGSYAAVLPVFSPWWNLRLEPHWKHPINQWINQIYLSTYQYLPIYLGLSMHISKPIFQSTKLSQSTKLAMSGLLTLNLTAMTRHSCSLSNFLLPWLVFQQQQLILAAVKKSTKNCRSLPSCQKTEMPWDKQPNNEMRVLGSGGSIFQVNSILCCQINLMP